MGWFRKRRGARPLRGIPKRVLAPVEEIVEQGLLVADVAVRMTVKNTIIMNALRRNMDYHEEEILQLVRDAATELAEERDRDAKHIRRMRDEIRDYGRSAWSESEYGNDDNRTLRHRQEVYESVASELRERAADEDYVRKTAEQAREAAWAEVGDSLKVRAEHPYYGGGRDEAYRQARGGRIQDLIEKDLTELMRQKNEAKSVGSGGDQPASKAETWSEKRAERRAAKG
ncbi:asparagine synthase [Leucobacter sp. M11]|uniref:asparagine synthase n=1 Tax=Leucobacter sp. M11 TaxID=2993565 RepID=UPI002D7F3E69|nr:asparagine synthase [Leucobacter sp. M11]MEB4613428.1 asparagine synthase [Leucobacter sp. M11]